MINRPLKAFKLILRTALLTLVFSLSTTVAHQHITYPTPISHTLACRIDEKMNCPGPCPNQKFRADQDPNKPKKTVQRGQTLVVHTAKNNHLGGFSRWTIVKIKDMFDKQKHNEAAFLYTCADNNISKCTRRNKQRDCRVDKRNEYFRHYIEIPDIYPDGNYVLGWSWYGGATKYGRIGAFGDYYDCIYIRIQGGAECDSYQPRFVPGNSCAGRNGLCRATTDRLGVCWRESCPGGVRKTVLTRPCEFKRRIPKAILRSYFEE